jgi:hypothetical protein
MSITESAIAEALISEDIESLFQHGAPENEYTPETRGIVKALALLSKNDITEERLVAIIRAVWSRSFGPFSDDEIEMRTPAIRGVANRILTSAS